MCKKIHTPTNSHLLSFLLWPDTNFARTLCLHSSTSSSATMISNFHQSSGPHDDEYNQNGSSYYTFESKEPTKTTSKKKKKKIRRMFGLGKSSNKMTSTSSMEKATQEDASTVGGGGQSLTYSSASSFQTTGESTDSSGAFGDILRMLDEEDAQQRPRPTKLSSDRSMYSTSSSLAYSEGATTLNYSEDGDQSYLEGTKLLLMQKEGLLGDYSSEDHKVDDVQFAPAVKPQKKSRKKNLKEDDGIVLKNGETKEEFEDNPDVSAQNPWLCGMEMTAPQWHQARNVLEPYLCFL
jgi:hypothetical protein